MLHKPEQEALFFFFFFFFENVLHAKDHMRVSCFTVLSVKHCLYNFSTLKALLTKNPVGWNVQSNTPLQIHQITVESVVKPQKCKRSKTLLGI